MKFYPCQLAAPDMQIYIVFAHVRVHALKCLDLDLNWRRGLLVEVNMDSTESPIECQPSLTGRPSHMHPSRWAASLTIAVFAKLLPAGRRELAVFVPERLDSALSVHFAVGGSLCLLVFVCALFRAATALRQWLVMQQLEL